MAKWHEHSRQDGRRVRCVNGSGYLAAVEPSIWRVQILSSSESGGVETREEPSQMVLSEGLRLLMATAGRERDPCHEQTGMVWRRRKATQGGTRHSIGTSVRNVPRRVRDLECQP